MNISLQVLATCAYILLVTLKHVLSACHLPWMYSVHIILLQTCSSTLFSFDIGSRDEKIGTLQVPHL